MIVSWSARVFLHEPSPSEKTVCNFLFFFSFLLCKGAGKSVDPITVAIFVQVPQKTVLPSTGGPCVHQSQADMRREGWGLHERWKDGTDSCRSSGIRMSLSAQHTAIVHQPTLILWRNSWIKCSIYQCQVLTGYRLFRRYFKQFLIKTPQRWFKTLLNLHFIA